MVMVTGRRARIGGGGRGAPRERGQTKASSKNKSRTRVALSPDAQIDVF